MADTHRKGGKDHLAPNTGAAQTGAHAVNRQVPSHDSAAQTSAHGKNQQPVTQPGQGGMAPNDKGAGC